MSGRTLILGMGNPILTDDAIGVRLARDLGFVLADDWPVDVKEECSVGGLNLLDFLQGYDQAIVFDAIHTTDGQPGQTYHFTAEALEPTINLSNVHDANFATALELGRKLGHHLPANCDIHVFAVEVFDDLTFGTELSPVLDEAYPRCREHLLARVRRLLGSWSPHPI
jgi:hydrogenase maturation protease